VAGDAAVDLFLSRTGPAGPYEPVVTGFQNSGSFDWTVTGPSTEEAYLKVVVYDSQCRAGSDVSDSAFSIITPTGIRIGDLSGLAVEMLSSNPLQGAANFRLSVPRPMRIRGVIYDVLGREVAVVASGTYPPGHHILTWNVETSRKEVPSGVYFLKLEADGRQFSRKIVLVR
jgi:hypothetical protein